MERSTASFYGPWIGTHRFLRDAIIEAEENYTDVDIMMTGPSSGGDEGDVEDIDDELF